jgi:hypothetical protein
MLDEESLENILSLLEDPRESVNSSASCKDEGQGWVNAIANRMRPEVEGGGGRRWLQVGIADYLWPMWFYPFDPDAMLGEMDWRDAENGFQNLRGWTTIGLRE